MDALSDNWTPDEMAAFWGRYGFVRWPPLVLEPDPLVLAWLRLRVKRGAYDADIDPIAVVIATD